MTATATKTLMPARTMTLDEFLELPETEPASEFMYGRIVQKDMPSTLHALITSRVIFLMQLYLHAAGIRAYVMDNARHAQRDEGRAYLPDVELVLRENMPKDRRTLQRGPIEMRPDIAIEVLSPGTGAGRLADRVAFFLRAGVPLTWIIDPIERSLTAFRPSQPSSYHEAPDAVDGAPVLPGFKLDLTELFGFLDEIEEAGDDLSDSIE